MHNSSEHIESIVAEFRRNAIEQKYDMNLRAYEREAARDAILFDFLAASLDRRGAEEAADACLIADPHAGAGSRRPSDIHADVSGVLDHSGVDELATGDLVKGNSVGDRKAILSALEGGNNVHLLGVDCDQGNKGESDGAAGRCSVAAISPSSLPRSSSSPEPDQTDARNAADPTGGRGDTGSRPRVRPSKAAHTKRTVTSSGTSQIILKPWNRLAPDDRFGEAIRHAAAQGGHSVTLNLSIGRQSGCFSSDDPMRNISKRINEALNDHGLADLPLALRLEAAPDTDQLHLHGVLIPGPHNLAIIKKALRQGAGLIEGRSGSRQVKLGDLPKPDGWAGYLAKAVRRTSRIVGHDRLTWVSHSLTSSTREHYEEVRRGQKPANRDAHATGSTFITFFGYAMGAGF